MDNNMLPAKDTIEKIFGIVKALNCEERKYWKVEESKISFPWPTYGWLVGIPLIIAVVSLVVSNIFPIPWLFYISLIALTITYMVMSGYPVFFLWRHILKDKRIRNLLDGIIDNVMKLAQID